MRALIHVRSGLNRSKTGDTGLDSHGRHRRYRDARRTSIFRRGKSKASRTSIGLPPKTMGHDRSSSEKKNESCLCRNSRKRSRAELDGRDTRCTEAAIRSGRDEALMHHVEKLAKKDKKWLSTPTWRRLIALNPLPGKERRRRVR